VEGLKQIDAHHAALGPVERSLGMFDEKQDAAEEEVLSSGENRKKGKKRQGSVLKRYAVESNSAFQRTKLEAAISLHAEIGRMKATEHKFKDQALAIFQAPGVKSNNGFTHEHILDAEKVYVVKRNPKCQIYFCKDLHAHFHGTVGPPMVERLLGLNKSVQVIEPTDSIVMDDLAVLNKSATSMKYDTHFEMTVSLIKKMVPGFAKAWKKPTKTCKRGTLSCNLGFTTNDANQYSQVRYLNRCSS